MKPERMCWGIYRERPHSPGRVDDDAAILDAVARGLSERGFTVGLLRPEEADAALRTPNARVFAMCEQEEILSSLQKAADGGAIVVNAPRAVRNTYRVKTLERFQAQGVPSPDSWVVSTAGAAPPPAAEVWVKRADFHATQPDDVLFARGEAEWTDALALFARRGMAEVVVQAHAPGDLVKFYGVAGGRGSDPWFDWFYHKGQTLSNHRFDRKRLADTAQQAAGALGLQVFGGDAIIPPDGAPVIIDLNAWPSFALVRGLAAAAIADHLAGAFEPEISVLS